MLVGGKPVMLLLEFLGEVDGFCGGMGGHVHLYPNKILAASSGIMGASGPPAVGLALTTQTLRLD